MPVEVQESKITTIEGIEANGKLHPLQETFAELGSAQCGYCTPGMLLSGIALLRDHHLIEPYTRTINGLRVTSCALGECLDAVAERSHWDEFHTAKAKSALNGNVSGVTGTTEDTVIKRGLGIAASSYICGAGKPIYWNDLPHSAVQIRLDRGGGVTVYCGATDSGQGSTSILAYIVAEELGIEPEHIHLETADTALTPVDLGSYSSRVTLQGLVVDPDPGDVQDSLPPS
ncbi:MAG TPA: molybdopterin cofactor-binding domain-containing protein [Ktedonobacteraceae bacterium]|nr:molybdopterin cofactor-binding domain-containing protein [Ktedonobacteraceae bacterium]